MSVLYDPVPIEVEGDPAWFWRVSQPVDTDGTAAGDVDLELAPILSDFDGDDLRRVLHVIARKLQYTASLLLSAPTYEGDDE